MAYNHTCQASSPLVRPTRPSSLYLSLNFFSLPLALSTFLLLLNSYEFRIARDHRFVSSVVLRSSWKFFETPRNLLSSSSSSTSKRLLCRAPPVSSSLSLLHRFTFQPLQLPSRFFGLFVQLLSFSLSLFPERYPSFFLISPLFVFQLSLLLPSLFLCPFSFCAFRFYDSIVLLLSCLPFISAHNSTM